jgi:hypothetical protein
MDAIGSPGDLWTSIIESARQRANTRASTSGPRTGRARLSLTAAPARRHLPEAERTADGIPPKVAAAIRLLVAGEAPWPLLLHGPPGTGKTCAGLVLLDHAGGEYFTAAGWARRLIDAQQGRLSWQRDGVSGAVTEGMCWAAAGRAPLVVLDELGVRGQVSDHAYEAVKQMIDARRGRPFVAISNVDLDALAKVYDDRVASRLGCGLVVRVDGPDRRVQG